MTRAEVLELIRAHLADELELDPSRVEEEHPLQAGPRGRLARPLHARPGARGLLRGEDVRRGGGAHPHRRAGRRLRDRPPGAIGSRAPSLERRAEALTPAQAARPARGAAGRPRPAGGDARLVDRAAGGVLRAPRLPRRLGARAGGHHAPLPAPGPGLLRRRAADQDPRPGRLRAARAARWPSASGCRSACAPRRRRTAARSPRRSCAPSGSWPR